MKNFKKEYYFVIVILFVVILGFFLTNYNSSTKKITENDIKYVKLENNNIKFVKIGGVVLKIDLAVTQQEQEQGLSDRKSLGEDEGMLFVFEKPAMNYFWMKDMNFPIDIIWIASSDTGINENLKIIYIKKDVLPELFPETYGPKENSKYVLEVNAGFLEKNNLEEGNLVEFLR